MKIIKYTFIFMAAALMAGACGEKKKAMEPEEVVKAFSQAVIRGDFDVARSLCDAAEMEEYLKSYENIFNSLQKGDSCTFNIATSLLAGADFEVNRTLKEGEERIVLYTLGPEGYRKAKKAIVKNEDGEWKVRSVTDAI